MINIWLNARENNTIIVYTQNCQENPNSGLQNRFQVSFWDETSAQTV